MKNHFHDLFYRVLVCLPFLLCTLGIVHAVETVTYPENSFEGTDNWIISSYDQKQRETLLGVRNPDEMSYAPLSAPSEAWTDTRKIDAYASKTSINRGESIDFHVATDGTTYSIAVYRMGWYEGTGGRFITGTSDLPGIAHPNPEPTGPTNIIEADWSVGWTLNTSTQWVTGVYIAKFIITSGTGAGEESYAIFVVRDDGGTQPILFVLEVTTWQAYNNFGGKSLYNANSTLNLRSYEVSFDRPYRDWTGAGYFFEGDYQMLRFLEREGYNVAYATSLDLHTNPNLLDGHEMMLANYHDEYYSWEMRDNVTSGRDNGVNLAYFTSNNIYWQVRFRANTDGDENRVIVCYKDALLDPMETVTPSRTTVQWRQAPVSRPENELLGVMYEDQYTQPNYPWVVQNSSHWIYTGTGLIDGNTIPGMVGYEYDRVYNNGLTPSNLIVLSSSPVFAGGIANASIYTHPASGATVFNASTNYWAQQLEDTRYDTINGSVKTVVQQMTRNILNTFTGIVPTPPVSSAAHIYEDGPNWEWRGNNNPPSTVKYDGTAMVYSGTRTLEFTPTGTNRVSLRNDTLFSTLGYDTLRLVVRSAGGGTARALNIQFWGAAGSSDVFPATAYNILAPSSTMWQVYNIPLSSLNAVNKQISYFWLRSTGAQPTVYVDDVVFLNAPPTTMGIGNVMVNEDAPPTVLSLWNAFADAGTPDDSLTYEVVSNSNAALFSSTSINPVTGMLTLNHAPDQNGVSIIVIKATDIGGNSINTSFTVTVNAVNDAPFFSLLGNQTASADAGLQTVGNFAYNMSLGPLNESSQNVQNFLVSVTSNPDLIFSNPPSINISGDLTYTFTGSSGVASLSVQLQDNGGSINGGVDLSAVSNFTITAMPTSAPTIISPSVNAEFNVPTTIVSWIGSSGLSSYELQIDTTNTFTNAPIFSTTSTSYTVNLTNAPVGVRYIRVRGITAGVPTAWSAVVMFNVLSALNSAPQVCATTTIPTYNITWERASYSLGYELAVSTTSSFSQSIFNDTDIVSTADAYTLPVLFDGLYYYRIRAKTTATTWGPWSIAACFVISVP